MAQSAPLSASGSNRQYFRETAADGTTSIRVVGTSREENHAFLYMSKHFANKGIRVPHVLSASSDEMEYTQEDLGNTLLFDYIAEGRKTGVFCEKEKEMLRRTIRSLAHIQVEGAKGFDWNVCYPIPEFNRRSVMWDLNYFKYCFLKATGLEFQEDRLENEFERLADILLSEKMDTFMYRDFQSRNVMVKQVTDNREQGTEITDNREQGTEITDNREQITDNRKQIIDNRKQIIGEGEPWFIDFQGGRKGPIYYDVASFLWQAKANFHNDMRQELIGEYLDELEQLMPLDREHFQQTLPHFVLFRLMQVLGAYGFRGYFEKKPHFLQSIPPAIENLRQLLQHTTEDYPYLQEVLREMTEMKQFKGIGEKKPLVVRVYSFSYKKGIPADTSGNGGGFVFDCRAVNNPGKYERYQGLTGLDAPVIQFIEDDGEMMPFLAAAYTLVDASVKRYIDRGFQHLMVSFGCTGGQHRSVYGAEKMAEHLNRKFGVEVELIHREQNIERKLEAKK